MRITRERVIGEIRRIAKKLGKNQVSLSEFRSNSDISDWHIWNIFGSWNEAVVEAGLKPHTEKEKIPDDALFTEMRRIFLDYGGICNRTMFHRLSKYSVDVYKRRFGRWKDILKAFRDWLTVYNEVFPFMDQLPETTNELPVSEKSPAKRITGQIMEWDAIGGTKYGPLLNFRSLQHAPLNEQGVVLLFGMICSEIGFIVEAVRDHYPDCEAKRRVHKTRDQWERVKIEFEYRSSHFKAHGHNPEQCDLVVCWIHDWEECPLEVIELRAVIEEME